jgi:hypothetical protein
MVLDDPSQVDWRQRLQRKGMDDCLVGVEKARITFPAGQTREVYVGGVLNGELWTSYEIDEKRRLQPHIERLPIGIISNYTIIN